MAGRRVAARLFDILDAGRVLREAVEGTDREAFLASRILRAGVERELEIVSEATHHLPPELMARWPDIPWDDIRGFGDTRGRLNWTSAQADTVTWATWLREQPGVTSVMFMGSSIGSSLALVGCLQVEGCAGAVALSPGLNYYQVYTGDAIAAGFPALIVYADHDPYPIRDVPKMIELADPDGDGAHHLSLQVYAGREHGMALFAAHDDLVGAITSWLADHH